MDLFEDQRRFRCDVDKLLPKIRLDMQAGAPGIFHNMSVEAALSVQDGSVLHSRCDGPRGSWRGPALAAHQHLAKVRECLGTLLTPAAQEEVIQLAQRVDLLN